MSDPGPTSTSTRRVRKAILPSAGFGTRMHPFSWVLPKELVPLGNTPALHFVLEEVARAGLREVAIVTRPGKGLLVEHLRRARQEGLFADLEIDWIEQPQPLGLGDAITCCRDFVGGEPFALLWPDNVALSPQHELGSLVRLHETTGLEVYGVLELTSQDSGRFSHAGRFRHQEEEDWESRRRVRILELFDKRPGRLEIPPGDTLLRTTGRIVANADLIEEIEASRTATDAELDEVAACQRLVGQRGAWGLVLPAALFDTGHPSGVLAASKYLAEQAKGGAS